MANQISLEEFAQLGDQVKRAVALRLQPAADAVAHWRDKLAVLGGPYTISLADPYGNWSLPEKQPHD